MRRKKGRRFRQFNFRLDPKLAWWGSLIFCCLILLVGLGYTIYTSSIFKINEGDIKDSRHLLSRGLKMKIKNKSLFSLDIKSISSSLLKAHPEYKEIYVYREFPSSVIIEATKRIPFAQIKDKKFYPVDKEAIILSEGDVRPLDNLIPLEVSDYSGRLKKGSKIKGKKLEYAFDLIDALGNEGLFDRGQVKLINANSLEAVYFIFVRKGIDVQSASMDEEIKVIVGKGDFRRKLKLLKDLIDHELKDKMFLLKYIDLRFKKVYMDFKR